jgi:LysR family transcriptional regulator, glycine cleavage system transcriptional activator
MKTLPPLVVLQAFEAASRLGNFSRAAAERNLTPGAISRHIQALEHWCGETLFQRNGPHVSLTEAGTGLQQRLNEPLQSLYWALSAPVQSVEHTLYVFTLPSIAISLLLPHLAEFQARHPNIRLSILTHYAITSLPPSLPAVAFRFGEFDHAGLISFPSKEERMVAVASAQWLDRCGADPDKWLGQAMLRHTDSPWPAKIGTGRGALKLPEAQGVEFNDAALLLHAAKLGLGVIWTREKLAAQAVADNTLVQVQDVEMMSGKFYWLTSRKEISDHPAITAFREWLLPAIL